VNSSAPVAPGAQVKESDRSDRETVIPLFEEEVAIAKRVVETGRVQISRVTHSREQIVDEMLERERVDVQRVAIEKPIDAMPSIRQEGDVTIIPVVEEIIRVERQLVLKEELHVRRIKETERYHEVVKLRSQKAEVSRIPIDPTSGLHTGAETSSPNKPIERK
jgi:uncharacterized protein (TIGR02271 family)